MKIISVPFIGGNEINEDLNKFLKSIKVLEGENAISKVKIDVDVREYVIEYK